MLFTSAHFLLLFLPVTLGGFFLFGRRSPGAAAVWLFLCSLFFYGYWMPAFTVLLLVSIAANFGCGLRIVAEVKLQRRRRARLWLIAGVAFNLVLLGYFKYANFFVDNLNALLSTGWSLHKIILPIGISFYSFTQIAFLADAYEGSVDEANPVHYGLFVTYFPHLVAGPVLHHAQMMPQFADPTIYRPRAERLIGGLAIFAIGLFKKVILADGVAPYADAVFGPVDAGALPTPQEAWLATVAYALQLYFDFSGYSDMAIGLSHMFNVRLPFNFDSPYRARNISDFWRRWHMSLSTFLRDYLYIPLGGSRHGAVRRYANLWVTMVLGGLWHGASWAFVIWGVLHGTYLTFNHAYRALVGEVWRARLERLVAYRWSCWMLTLLAVLVAWIFFRAQTFGGAWRMLGAMSHRSLVESAMPALLWNAGLDMRRGVAWCFVLSAVALFAPNSNHVGERILAGLQRARSLPRAAVAGAVLGAVSLLLLVNVARESISAFIYFNF